MRKIILNVAVSIDGLIEGPNGEYDWCFSDQDYNLTKFTAGIDALFIGRKTFEVLEKGGTDYFANKTKYVFSKTRNSSEFGNVIFIAGDIIASAKEICAQPGKNIWLFGGAQLLTAFLEADMVDELQLSVHPVVLGSGKPLFQNIADRKWWKLANSEVFSSGLIQLTYTKV